MHVRVRVSPRAAIMARKAAAGVISVEVSDADLQDLPDEELEELAKVVESDEVLEDCGTSATFEAVRAVLSERARAAREASEADERAASARAAAVAEIEGAARRDLEERSAERTRSIRTWVEENGTDDQRDRMREGFLHPEEILEEVADLEFEVGEEEYEPLEKGHACDCERGCAGSVGFTVQTSGFTLDSRQFATLERIRESAPEGAAVEVRMHKAACPECRCTPLARMSALVTLPWGGWLLAKEYKLG